MMLERLAKLLAVTTLGLALGCSINTYTIGVDQLHSEDVPAIDQPYALPDALAQLGPPHRLSATPNGYVLAWEQWYIKEDKLGLSLRPLGLDLLSFDWGDARSRGDFLLMYFDHRHRLIDSGYLRWSSDAGGGQGIQPLFGFIEVVDVDDLTQSMPQHNWGSFMLNKLPIALNAASHMDTGQNGIQQRGTTSSVGQHTLEMN